MIKVATEIHTILIQEVINQREEEMGVSETIVVGTRGVATVVEIVRMESDEREVEVQVEVSPVIGIGTHRHEGVVEKMARLESQVEGVVERKEIVEEGKVIAMIPLVEAIVMINILGKIEIGIDKYPRVQV